jgi:hypothetical protein
MISDRYEFLVAIARFGSFSFKGPFYPGIRFVQISLFSPLPRFSHHFLCFHMLYLIMVLKVFLHHLFIFFLHLLFHFIGLFLGRGHPCTAGTSGSADSEKDNDENYVTQTSHFDVKI